MDTIQIRKGRDIKLKGAALKQIAQGLLPKTVAVQPSDFRGIKPRPAVKPDDLVKVGSPLLTDKFNPDIKVVSSVSGRVVAVNRGEKRVLLQIVVEADGRQEFIRFRQFSSGEIANISREQAIAHLLEGGLWPTIRQRPFSKIANPHTTPKSIFIQAMNTEPLALDIDFILQDKEAEFQTGLNILRLLTQGDVHLCISEKAQSKVLTKIQGVKIHRFAGPHPAGNVSTHIHYVDPIHKGDIVWYIGAQDVLRVASLFLNGVYPNERYVAVTGEGAENRVYLKMVVGASISSFLNNRLKENMRYISGSILNGTNVGMNGYLSYYDTQLTVIPEGGQRHFLGWLVPGFDKYSFSKTFVSSFLPQKETSLDTDKQGSDRAIVLNSIYDQYVSLDIMTFFLLRAVISGDIEEAEKLGILECDEEDFALCTFACPSKTDVGGIIRNGLDLIEKEG